MLLTNFQFKATPRSVWHNTLRCFEVGPSKRVGGREATVKLTRTYSQRLLNGPASKRCLAENSLEAFYFITGLLLWQGQIGDG
jgi:hypothetical protein